MNELQLFRQGHDTTEIANLTGQTEPAVYNALIAQRKADRRRQRDREFVQGYKRLFRQERQSKLLPYAGYDPFERTAREWR